MIENIPWTFVTSSNGAWEIWDLKGTRLISDDSGDRVHSQTNLSEEEFRLIAAAPEMFELLKDALAKLKEESYTMRSEKLMKQIDSLIQKIEGESERDH